MADESERIHETIVATRQDLEEKLERLRRELRRRIDVRRRIGERPWLALGGSIAAGFVVGRMTRGHRTGSRSTGTRRDLQPRSLLTHVAFALLSGMVHEIIDRQVPRLVGRMTDRDRSALHDGDGGLHLSRWEPRPSTGRGASAGGPGLHEVV